jgi:hypothetical protein
LAEQLGGDGLREEQSRIGKRKYMGKKREQEQERG